MKPLEPEVEREVRRLVAKGYKLREIGQILGCSRHAVTNTLRRDRVRPARRRGTHRQRGCRCASARSCGWDLSGATRDQGREMASDLDFSVATGVQYFVTPAVAVAQEVFTDELLMKTVTTRIHETGAGPASFETILTSYLQAEKQVGRIDDDVDEAAFGFLLAGAIHNLIVSGPGYARPTKRQCRRFLTALATRLTSTQPPEDNDATTR